MRQPPLRLLAAGDTLEVFPSADLSSVAEAELEADRKAMLTRLVTRGITKYLVSREMEKKAEDKGGEVLGFITGRLANFAANETERADTRSWTLLPDDVALVRLSLPPGVHQATLETFDGSGRANQTVVLPPIEVVAGGVTVLSQRLWSQVPATK